jgi:hypothetical protein
MPFLAKMPFLVRTWQIPQATAILRLDIDREIDARFEERELEGVSLQMSDGCVAVRPCRIAGSDRSRSSPQARAWCGDGRDRLCRSTLQATSKTRPA